MRILLLLLLSLMTVYATESQDSLKRETNVPSFTEPLCSLKREADAPSLTNSTKWALLVAGSNGYENYRHQADICHAYQILHENGYPDSNIIVMMYDDIAYNLYNPYPGVIINSPNGRNVYDGVPKDYTKHQVTPKNFLGVLSGNTSMATGRVIPSSPDNDIFIYFADHGGPGLLGFPHGVLYAHHLRDVISDMYEANHFRSIVFYVEACESGSMFNMLYSNTERLYALTAATPDQSSWGCYCNSSLNTCLGDTFSVNFLQNSDSFEHIINETLSDQYYIVRHKTHKSRVCMYGDFAMQNRNLSHYLIYNYTHNNNEKCYPPKAHESVYDQVDTRDYKIQFLLNQYSRVNDDLKADILEELRREIYQDVLLEKMYGRPEPRNVAPCYPSEYIDTRCLEQKIEEFKNQHGPLTESFFKYIRLLGHNCINSQ